MKLKYVTIKETTRRPFKNFPNFKSKFSQGGLRLESSNQSAKIQVNAYHNEPKRVKKFQFQMCVLLVARLPQRLKSTFCET